MLSTGVMESTAVRRIQPLPYVYGRGGFTIDAPEQDGAGASGEQTDSGATRGINKSPDELALNLERFVQEQEASAPERAYLAAGRRYAMVRHDPAALAAFPGAAQAAPAQSDQTLSGQPLSDAKPGSAADSRSGRQSETDSLVDHTGKIGQHSSGGTETRSPERTFLGGTAGTPEDSSSRPGSRRNSLSEHNEEAEDGATAAEQLTEEETQEVEELKARDREVKTHEQAHISAGAGLVAGGASYQKTRGPDGNMYAVGGEVQIDISEGSDPDSTIAKAQKIKSAALAPSEPSSQDRQVAAQAAQMEASARQEKNTSPEDDPAASSDSETTTAERISEGDISAATSSSPENGLNRTFQAGKAYHRAASLEFSYAQVRADAFSISI